MLENLLKPVLVILVGFALKWLFALINFNMDEALFNTLVAAIVTALTGLFFAQAGAEGVKAFKAYRARLK